MATFINGSVPSLMDLWMYEGGILETANTEGVDLKAKAAVARDEIGAELLLFLVKRGAGESERPRLEHVAITPALRQWHTLHTLALAYRDCYFNQLNDRYKAKWREYERLAARAQSVLTQSGVGMILRPIPRAGAAEFEEVGGSVPMAASYYVQTSWVGAGGVEGEPGEMQAHSMSQSGPLRVWAPAAPPEATGWNVYVGASAEWVYRQNAAPLTPGEAWTMPTSGLISGRLPGWGQEPDYYVMEQQIVWRG